MASASVVITKWNAAAIKSELRGKIADAINESAQEGVEAAQSQAPVDTGRMRADLQITEEATVNTLTATFGAKEVDYTLWVEIGSQGRAGRYFLRYGHDVAKSKLMTRLKGIL
jgi:hypothetical protein